MRLEVVRLIVSFSLYCTWRVCSRDSFLFSHLVLIDLQHLLNGHPPQTTPYHLSNNKSVAPKEPRQHSSKPTSVSSSPWHAKQSKSLPSDQAVTLHPRSNFKMPANKASLASLALLKSLTRSWDFASPRMPYGGFKRKLPRMSMSSRGRFAFLEVQSKRLMIFVFKNECS